MGRLVIVAIALSSCYSPQYRDCAISCPDQKCPSDLSCELGMCRLSGMHGACPADGDGGIDGPGPDADLSCWTGMQPTNFDPCEAFPTSVGPLVVSASPTVFDTDQGRLNGGAAPGGLYHFNGDVWLVHVQSLTQNVGATFQLIGVRPLLIVSDGDIVLNGVIDASARNTAAGPCPDVSGSTGAGTSSGAGGGGGGGHGTAGGGGGQDSTGAHLGGPGMSPQDNAQLSPLRAGCPGGTGGKNDVFNGAKGGNGGGGIELVSRTSITVKQLITAGGGGGSPGGINASSTGGGGGGAGGSILLEAPTITIATNAQLCAPGGGGGQGGTPSGTGLAAGATGGCGSSSGGDNGMGGGGGGAGAQATTETGGDGNPGRTLSTPTSGGGGGGGTGRIRLHTNVRIVQSGTKIVPADTP